LGTFKGLSNACKGGGAVTKRGVQCQAQGDVKGRLHLKRSEVNPRYFTGGLHSHVFLRSHPRSTVSSLPATYMSEFNKCILVFVHHGFFTANLSIYSILYLVIYD